MRHIYIGGLFFFSFTVSRLLLGKVVYGQSIYSPQPSLGFPSLSPASLSPFLISTILLGSVGPKSPLLHRAACTLNSPEHLPTAKFSEDPLPTGRASSKYLFQCRHFSSPRFWCPLFRRYKCFHFITYAHKY